MLYTCLHGLCSSWSRVRASKRGESFLAESEPNTNLDHFFIYVFFFFTSLLYVAHRPCFKLLFIT